MAKILKNVADKLDHETYMQY